MTVAEHEQQAFRTPEGIYLPHWVADALRPVYRAPDSVLPDPMLSMLATPIYILPPPTPQPRPRWWIRAWWRLTHRRSR